MTRWRKRIGEAEAEELSEETIEADLKLKAVKPSSLSESTSTRPFRKKKFVFPQMTGCMIVLVSNCSFGQRSPDQS